jgi:hypothetical protein
MVRLLAAVGLVTALLVVPANAVPRANAANMSYGACKTKVMQDGRKLDSSCRCFCGRLCHVWIRECMAGR